MNKKIVVVSCITIIGILVCLNIFLYSNNNKVNSYLEEGSLRTDSMLEISKFRIEINKMAQAQKLYFLAGKDKYKKEYEYYLTSICSKLNVLETRGIIDKVQREELLKSINNFNLLNENLGGSANLEHIPKDTEELILQLNDSQINILSQLDSSIDDTKNVINDNNSSAIANTDLQVNGVHIVSTIITGLTSVFLYFLKKGTNSETINKFIDCIDEIEDKNKTVNKKEKSLEDIEKIKVDIGKYEELLKIVKILYSENNSIKYNIEKCRKSIEQIDNNLYRLKIEIKDCSDLSQELFDNIQKQIVELRIEFQALPLYNKIILDLYNIIINEENKIEK